MMVQPSLYLAFGDRPADDFVEVLEAEAESPADEWVCRPKEAFAALGPQGDEYRVHDEVGGHVAEKVSPPLQLSSRGQILVVVRVSSHPLSGGSANARMFCSAGGGPLLTDGCGVPRYV